MHLMDTHTSTLIVQYTYGLTSLSVQPQCVHTVFTVIHAWTQTDAMQQCLKCLHHTLHLHHRLYK